MATGGSSSSQRACLLVACFLVRHRPSFGRPIPPLAFSFCQERPGESLWQHEPDRQELEQMLHLGVMLHAHANAVSSEWRCFCLLPSKSKLDPDELLGSVY